MRVHDVAFYQWLAGLQVDYSDLGGSAKPSFPILRVYASPMRAYASIVDLLVEQGFVEGANAEEMRKNAEQDFAVLPLPVATIERDEPTNDPELPGGPTKELRRMEWDGIESRFIKHPFPAHYRTDYRVTLWCIKRYTDAFMREWLYSQLGQRGWAENELYIVVDHKEPWGQMWHALRFTGSTDLSDLEGEGARYIRKEYAFSLRTWLMKPVRDGDYPVEISGRDFVAEAEGGVALDSTDMSVQSSNLFRVPVSIPRLQELWPLDGDATIETSEEFPNNLGSYIPITLKIGVADQDDRAHIIETPSDLDVGGLDLFSVAFQYKAEGRVELEIMQRDLASDTVSSADSLILPAASRWTRVHFFSLVSKGSYLARIAGIPNQPA